MTSFCVDLIGFQLPSKRKHFRFRENDEDRPPLKVLELRGIRRVWVIFVVHKSRSFTWTCNVRFQCPRGSALKLFQPAYLRPGFDLHHGKKDAYLPKKDLNFFENRVNLA